MAPMAHTTSRPPKTVEDYRTLPRDVRAELIGGELYMTPAPTPAHQDVVLQLARYLADYADRTGSGRAFVAPVDVYLPTGDVVQPDLILVAKTGRAQVTDCIAGVPDLLIEVLSPFNAERDLVVKRHLYARNEVPAFWIADPMEGSIQLLRLGGDGYRPEAYFHGDADLTTAFFPGLRVPLATIFR